MKPNYKLVCWDDFSIPVPTNHKWLTWDKSGKCYSSKIKPVILKGEMSVGESWLATPDMKRMVGAIIDPPEPGPWNTQLYWIG